MISICLANVINSTNPARPGKVLDVPLGTHTLQLFANDTKSLFITKDDLRSTPRVFTLLSSLLTDLTAAKEDLIVKLSEAGKINNPTRNTINNQMVPDPNAPGALIPAPNTVTTYRALVNHFTVQVSDHDVDTLIRDA